MANGVFRPRSVQGTLSAELVEQLTMVGIDHALVDQAWHTDGLVNETRRRGIQSFTDDPGAKLAIKQVAEENEFKFGLFPDYSGAVENIGSQREISASNGTAGSEYIRVAISPTAVGRVVEPVASICRALDLVKSGQTDEAGHLKILRIGMRSAFALGLARTIFEQAGERHNDAEYTARLLEMQAVKPTYCQEVGPFMVDEMGLMFGGAVALRSCREAMIEEFKPNASPSAKSNARLQIQVMLQALMLSRKTTGERTPRRRVSYALEHAYTQDEMRNIIEAWFVPRIDPGEDGGSPIADDLKTA